VASGARVTGVDFSAGMLARARRKVGEGRVRFVQHDLHEPLPFPAESFDLLVSALVLEHLRDLDPFFAECHRVLRPGARAVVSAMHPAMFHRGAQARFTDPDSGEIIQPGSVSHALEALSAAVTGAGFVILELGEFAPDDVLAASYPRAAKYVGHPMLVVLHGAR
jgi:malonyl-CoA O-methyltransferase